MASRLSSALAAGLVIWFAGCTTCPNAAPRSFDHKADSFTFRNELMHTYTFDAAGNMSSRRMNPVPGHALHCFPMVRAAREFFYHVRFDPTLPPLAEDKYEALIREVVRRDSRCPSRHDLKIVFPGFENLAEFSRVHEALLKNECGAKWNSYTQRGNWRMIFPFSRRHQANTAKAL